MLFAPKSINKPAVDSSFFQKKQAIIELEVKIQEAGDRIIFLDQSIVEKTGKIQQIESDPEYNALNIKYSQLTEQKRLAQERLNSARTDKDQADERLRTAQDKLKDYMTRYEAIVGACIISGGLMMQYAGKKAAEQVAKEATKKILLAQISGGALIIISAGIEIVHKVKQYLEVQELKRRVGELKAEVRRHTDDVTVTNRRYDEAQQNLAEVNKLAAFKTRLQESRDDSIKSSLEKITLQGHLETWRNQLAPLKIDYEKNKPRIIPQLSTESLVSPIITMKFGS